MAGISHARGKSRLEMLLSRDSYYRGRFIRSPHGLNYNQRGLVTFSCLR